MGGPTPKALLRTLAPFALATVLAFALVAATSRVQWSTFAAAAALTVGVVCSAAWLPWGRLPSMLRVGPALAFLLACALLRDAAGGAASGVGVIALLPAFWLALHGERRQLSVVLAGVAIYFLAPVIFIGGTNYPTSGYRSAVIFVVVSSIVCFTTQGLVEKVRRHAADAGMHTRDLGRVAAISRELATSRDARTRVCEAACELTAATFAFLMEPDGDGGFVSTAGVGMDGAPVRSGEAGSATATRTAFETAQPLFLGDAAARPACDAELWDAHGRPASMLFQPVLRGDDPVGVLVIGWAEPTPAGRRSAILSLLAGEASFAIDTADLVARLEGLATVDGLTGVLNRRGWDLKLRRAFSDPEGQPLCVALLDLDRFKAFNDSRGHQSGDRLLREAAAAWRELLRTPDVIARYGGEEFAVLLPACELAQGGEIVDRLRTAMPYGETCSAGVARWDGRESADALLRRADQALYAAKATGRDRTIVAQAAATAA